MKTVEELAEEAGGEETFAEGVRGTWWQFGKAELERFATLVRAQALGEAAEICERQRTLYTSKRDKHSPLEQLFDRYDANRDTAGWLAEAIRAAWSNPTGVKR